MKIIFERLPDNYKIEQNLRWEDFEVNTEYDDSYEQLNFDKIEFKSDIFITSPSLFLTLTFFDY